MWFPHAIKSNSVQTRGTWKNQTKLPTKKSRALKNWPEMKIIQTTQSNFGEPWLGVNVK